ncbi:Hsp70 family protein [Microbacterium sp. 1P10UB]|uniref:Hsp70 family protein n=1 Tax=unclassified Microbacterium TaxID=2609290 RepID=UPI0039A127FA
MSTSYYLAVDVGTSRTAAAVLRAAEDAEPVSFPLGRHSDSAPSAVFVADGELLFGDAAARRAIAQPERVIREFKRRIGDDVPILAGDRRFAPEDAFAEVVTWVIDVVSEREGAAPSGVAVTVPVEWRGHRIDAVRGALARAGWKDVLLLTEPEAAARRYEASRPVPPGRFLAVYDLGGGTFDAVVLRKTHDGVLAVAGAPAGIATLGGSDFDDLVLRHAVAAAGIGPEAMRIDDESRVAWAAMRRECIDAKESLSFDSEAVVPILIGGGRTTVRLTRSEFEDMIEESIGKTADVLGEAMTAADLDTDGDDLHAILLTGGSSRIPRVAQLLSERFDRPIAVDADPKAIIALGAAMAAAASFRVDEPEEDDAFDEAPQPAPPVVPQRKPRRRWVPSTAGAAAMTDAAPAPSRTDAASSNAGVAASAAETPAPRPARRGWLGRGPAAASVIAGALVLAGGITISVLSGSLPDGADAVTETPPASSTPAATPAAGVPSPSDSATPLLQPADTPVVLFGGEDEAAAATPAPAEEATR